MGSAELEIAIGQLPRGQKACLVAGLWELFEAQSSQLDRLPTKTRRLGTRMTSGSALLTAQEKHVLHKLHSFDGASIV